MPVAIQDSVEYFAVAYHEGCPQHAADRLFTTATDSITRLSQIAEPDFFAFAEQPNIVVKLGTEFLGVFTFGIGQVTLFQRRVAECMGHGAAGHVFKVGR